MASCRIVFELVIIRLVGRLLAACQFLVKPHSQFLIGHGVRTKVTVNLPALVVI